MVRSRIPVQSQSNDITSKIIIIIPRMVRRLAHTLVFYSSTLLLSSAGDVDRRRVPVPHVAGNELAQQPAAGPDCRILWDVVVVQLRGDDGRVLLDIEAGIDADR